jgi:CheY-like chemotaxis protein
MGPHASESPHPDAAGRCRVLIADDNKDLADCLAKLLRLAGCEAETVYGGREAVEAARAHRPDIILLDIGLPGMDGFGVAERIRADMELSDVIIIAMSAYSPVTTQGRRAEAVFNDYLVKPVDHDVLLGVLSQAHRRSGESFDPTDKLIRIGAAAPEAPCPRAPLPPRSSWDY